MTAALSLSGHRAARLHVLDLGLFDVGPGKRLIGIPGFLATTDRGAHVLIDTGFDPAYATAPEATSARDGLTGFGRLVGYGVGQTLPGQLAKLGLTVDDLAGCILTHSHIDHIGALPLLRCPVWLGAAERAAPPLYWSTGSPFDWPDLTYHPVARETDLCHGLRLIPTPGHTPGHLSVQVSLPDKTVLLAADAINRASEPEEGYADAMDPALAKASGDHLLALATETGALLIYGHDPAQWESLPKAPAAL